MNEADPKEYKASLWTRKDESITFAVKFMTGSHVNITMALDGESNCPCSFPFRHENVMYYGCTSDHKCAEDVDDNLEAYDDLISCEPETKICPYQSNNFFL